MPDLRHEFANPSRCWKSRPLWFWNGPLSEGQTEQIMVESLSSGYAGFGILPGDGMGLDFMSEAYLDHYRFALEKADALGMKMCLYDEFWFPSGQAGGLLAEQYPEALSKRLDMTATDVVGPCHYEQELPAGRLMAAVAMEATTKSRRDLRPHMTDGPLTWSVPAGRWKIMLFTCVDDGARGLVDYLDPASVRRFASLTYDAYYEAFPDHFGTTIDSAFYDEPTFHWVEGGRAWTPAFNARFEERYGVSPELWYPALWLDIGPDTAAARNALFGLRTELFATGFVKTLNDWCRDHGIELTGHVDQEEAVNPVGLCGDLIKVFEHQDIPGVDQVFKYDRGSCMYKVVSSAATNHGRCRVMSETHGAIRNMPVANLYREGMDQFAKGINMMVPHAVWYDPQGRILPPELSYRTKPYASELPAYNEYVGRLQRLLQHGRPVVDIGVLYPIHGLQAAYHFEGELAAYEGGVIPDWADYMDVGETLSLDVRHDFTYLHPEILAERCRINGPRIRLEHKDIHQEYQVLILPGSSTLAIDALAQAGTFFNQGGKIIATTRLPDQSAELGRSDDVRRGIAEIFGNPESDGTARYSVHRNALGGAAYFIPAPDTESLAEVLADALPLPDVAWETPVQVEDGHLTYLHKVIDGHEFYFFANSSKTPIDTGIRIRGEHQLERWDPHTGAISSQPATVKDGTTRVQLKLEPVSSVFLCT